MSALPQYSIEDEYKKKHHITPEDIQKLREWLYTQPHLPGNLITDLDLVLAYHSCERSSEVTKQVLDLHFTLKTLFTGLFKDRDYDKRAELAFNTILLQPVTTKSPEGYSAFFCHLVDLDPRNFIFADVMRAALMVVDLWQYEEGTWPGFLIIIDMTGISLTHISKLDLTTLQHFFYFLQEAMLVRLKGMHFLNAPSFMDKLLMLIRPFMKKSLLDVLHIHQIGAKTIDKHFPLKALPKEAGGEGMSLAKARDDVAQKIKANRTFFMEESKKRVIESNRPGKAKTITDIFGGIEGSFKKLDID